MCKRCENKGVLNALLTNAGLAAAAPAEPPASPAESSAAAPARRQKLWQLAEKLHCPVIGTCLSIDELTRLAKKFGFEGRLDDAYRLHVEAVSLSCSRNPAAEAMQAMLEKKFSLDVARCNRLKTDAEVLAWWQASLQRGEVAGPMWAAMSHKAAGRATRDRIYADVHMLSHQVGAGQAADLRRLEWLQGEHARLKAENAELATAAINVRQDRDSLRRELDEARARLAAQAEEIARLAGRVEFLESGQAMVAIGRRLVQAEGLASQLAGHEQRFQGMREKIGVLRAEKVHLTRELEEASNERDALERLWLGGSTPACNGDCSHCDSRLAGRCVLCVGGRTALLPQYRQLAERMGVRLIHHDGGREETLQRLPDLLGTADAVICPTDCVGHLAYYQLKKHCKQNGKPCVLAKSGVASFAAALTRLASGHADIRSQT